MQKSTVKSRRIIPAYQRIEDDLRAKMETGNWQEDMMLPSRRMLAVQYKVSVPTIERAIANLLMDGLLRTDDRRGTFVAVRPEQIKAIQSFPVPVTASKRLDIHITVGIVSQLKPMENGLGVTDKHKEAIINSVERTITRAGGTALFFNLHRDDSSIATTEEGVKSLLEKGVSAVVLVLACEPNEIPQAIAAAAQQQIPLIFIINGKSKQPIISACFDSYDAGYQAAQHLLERGCRDLMFFAPYTCQWVQERLAGVRQAVLAANLPSSYLHEHVSAETIDQKALGNFDHLEDAYLEARALLTKGLPVQGVICANDRVALGFRQAALEAGLVMGQNYALVGFDDLAEAREVGLTSLHPPMEELGQEAGRLALRALAGYTAPIQVCLHMHLVSRSSSRLTLPRSKSWQLHPAASYA